MKERDNKKAQVWIETIIYTSIALLMIGLILTYARPKIAEFQDKATLEKSLEMIRTIDNTISTIGVPGNRRFVETGIKKGELKIDGENNLLIFEMESNYVYSEPGKDIIDSLGGKIVTRTDNTGSLAKVNFTINYTKEYIDLTYNGNDKFKTFGKSPSPYKLLISNNGKTNGETTIDISLSGVN